MTRRTLPLPSLSLLSDPPPSASEQRAARRQARAAEQAAAAAAEAAAGAASPWDDEAEEEAEVQGSDSGLREMEVEAGAAGRVAAEVQRNDTTLQRPIPDVLVILRQ